MDISPQEPIPEFKNGIYQHSSALNDILTTSGWNLYDITHFADRKPEWEELQTQPPSRDFELSHSYFLVPVPQDGQTLRDAYAVTKGLGPALLIVNPDENRWKVIALAHVRNLAVFTRITFNPRGAFCHTPYTKHWPHRDIVGIDYPFLLETFQRDYLIITGAEYTFATRYKIYTTPAYAN